MSLDKLLKNVRVLAVVCNQWGDTGKGKLTDYFSSSWAEVIARGTGGNNAGHTVVINGREKIFHLLPSGITYDSQGRINILGNGMVIDIKVLLEELDGLKREHMPYNNLMISEDANVIMPWHIETDVAKNKYQTTGGIGSTGRGIGPCYTDKIARKGIRVIDLFNRDTLAKKIQKVLESYPDQKVNIDDVIGNMQSYADRIKPFVRDTAGEMHRFMREGKRILLEGAQGLLLSIEHGTFPYVTSSDCSLNGTASGVGLSAQTVDLSLGIIKFPFMTRVGAGPFPTEFGGKESEFYCGQDGHTKKDELEKYGIPHTVEDGRIRYDKRDKRIMQMINSPNQFIQGTGIRLAAGEYGATTGRPRRTGWTDAVAASYAVSINGPVIVLTKVDCLSGADSFNICYGYTQDPQASEVYTQFRKQEKFLRSTTPKYETYRGYSDISSVRDFSQLPKTLIRAIEDFERFTKGHVAVVSIGPESEQTIVR